MGVKYICYSEKNCGKKVQLRWGRDGAKRWGLVIKIVAGKLG